MRYRLPDDCAGISHAGTLLERAIDGTVEAAETAALALAPHGLVPIDDKPAGDTPATKPARNRSRIDDGRLLR